MMTKSIKKAFYMLIIINIFALFSACSNGDNAIWWSDITTIHGAQNHAATLELGHTLQLSASPSDNGLDWKSDNESVATVDKNGLVTAVGLGEATITVYPKDFEGAANGNYVIVTVVNKSIGFVDDQIDQSEAE